MRDVCDLTVGAGGVSEDAGGGVGEAHIYHWLLLYTHTQIYENQSSSI